MNSLHEMPMMAASAYASNTINHSDMIQTLQRFQDNQVLRPTLPPNQPAKVNLPMAQTQRRLIQVFIADPDENVPLDQCLLYTGEQKLTDLTDQELFFEVDVKSILDAHNQKRIALVNKAVKERTEHLEPARVRDLKMTVVTIAQF